MPNKAREHLSQKGAGGKTSEGAKRVSGESLTAPWKARENPERPQPFGKNL